ncbi:MAG: amidohydrolase [Candidatus Hydrogenedentes bacterium]|nr:amidohydrolase [Candidatus Hydrogenedentota bacterium]
MPVNRRQFLGAASLAAAHLASAESPPIPDTVDVAHWTFTQTDASIAAEVQSSLPDRMFDIHAHWYRTQDLGNPCPELPAQGPATVSMNVWKEHLGQVTGQSRLAGGLFFPYPVKNGDVDAGNEFLVEQVQAGEFVRGLVVVTPQSSREKMAAYLKNPRILGFKPYHVFASVPQTFDAAVEDYIPEWVWELAHEHESIIMLHIVRTGALSDPGNQQSLLRLCAKYPGAKLVLAHAGRGFHAPNTINALPVFAKLENVYFDTAAVCEPDAMMAIVKSFGARRLLWGSDFPVSQQRGKCVTVGDAFSWICPRRIDIDPSAPACHPTLVGLESLRALKLAAQLMDWSRQDIDDIFFNNALRLLRIQES